ncbi:DUF5058 family protein [Evansella cellulosilytica]|uniref:DUF5058 family protein n=1 Tax=Evansella cellulosilytica (strain ATCC 21833 / DSM 2522 / FERM P-1141 / JCM 9156 / N-4) TaxID=649639 RepID=E6TSN3_EVAC2|nr:DUF5058 family protein [Evansella cellulosilytica]ADU29541.1 hypothetical protein Bcell_1276 [Evansella cellulosilytica DSM 2522]
MIEVMEIANSGVIWFFALLIISIVIIQALLFIKLAAHASSSINMSSVEVKSAIKTGAISAIGPSLAIMVIAVSLITILGDPLTLMRIGIIGSAPIEALGASIGADAYGTELGSSSFTAQALTTVVWTLCLGGAGGLLVVAIFTKSFGKIEKRVTSKSKNGNGMIVLTTAALIGAFSFFVSGEMVKSNVHTFVAIGAGLSMVGMLQIANKRNLVWLKEWSLGIAILAGLFVGYIMTLGGGL